MAEISSLSAVCLNQFALDFQGNLKRIIESIRVAKSQKSKFRCGPELEIPGYNCEDHFFESDTLQHSWEILAELLKHEDCQDILVSVGMPVMHRGVTYNCCTVFLNRKVILIRPKMVLCDDGNYRESRWFTGWPKTRTLDEYRLPPVITEVTSQKSVLFGDALLDLDDTCIGFEICEELWTPASTHIEQSLAGAEIIVNGSGSHAEIRKANWALGLVKSASGKCGGAYVFSNLRGCDGERVYHNGMACVALNGDIIGKGEQFHVKDVEVKTVHFNLNQIRVYKNGIRSRSSSAARTNAYPTIKVDWSLSSRSAFGLKPTPAILDLNCLCPEEEISRGPALWMWDYLRRSKASGFFLPLSGGVDSSSVAILVYSMCHIVCEYLKSNEGSSDQQVWSDLYKVLGNSNYQLTSAADLCGEILTTCYMGSKNSSQETRTRARTLAENIGSKHFEIDITSVTDALVQQVSDTFQKTPTFQGEKVEHLALQNVQARSRMVYAYLMAQLAPWAVDKKGFLLVLGTSNVDEAIRGYFTKYDCSSADLNPIGGISKTDLKSFIIYAGKKFNFPYVSEIVQAPPTAELAPLESKQTDEQDMGMTYEELSLYGRLRKPRACGPFSMVAHLLRLWKGKHEPHEIRDKVIHFYNSYAANRHKMSTLTPACHMESYSPEDNRHDLRPLFYPDFSWQYAKIDELVNAAIEEEGEVD